jgi:FKBP-type peptidyl-prolyl cis-trans isomerase FkpA
MKYSKFASPIAMVLSLSLMLVMAQGAYAEEDADAENTLYYMGIALGQNLTPFGLSDDEVGLVIMGLRESLAGEARDLDPQVYGPKVAALAEGRIAAGAEQETVSAQAYLDKMAGEDGATTTESGIVIVSMVDGTGASPTADSTVTAHYHGTLRDGTVFDSSVERGEPFTSSLANVIPCWRDAIPTMKEGGKSKITCPSDTAYGSRGSGAIPGGAALTFEVELISVGS